MAGFVNYVKNLYEFHSVLTEAHAHGIAQQIMHINKDIIDTTQAFYFNDMFSLRVKCNVNSFLECYMGWKAFKPIEYGEIFLETKIIYALQQGALDTLKSIKEEYKSDSKFTDIMNEVLDDYDKAYAQCKDCNNRIKYIGDNLNVIFYKDMLVNDLKRAVNAKALKKEEIYSKIVDTCFGIFLNDRMGNKKYKDVIEFLFCSEIIGYSFGTGKDTRLASVAGKEMPYRKIYDFFYYIIAKEYKRRMDESNEKQSG